MEKTSVSAFGINGRPFFSSEKNIFFRRENIVRLLPLKTRITQIGTITRHTTYLDATCAKCHGPILWYIYVHHYSNPDPITDLTYDPNTHHIQQLHNPSIWSVSRNPVLGKYHYYHILRVTAFRAVCVQTK